MAKTTRILAWMMVMAVALVVPSAAIGGVVEGFDRVRSSDPALYAVLRSAAERSALFRQMVEAINASDAIVYVEPGTCKRNERACLTAISVMGASRALWVRVDTRTHDSDANVMGAIGHELRHTLEVIADPGVTSNETLYYFYRNYGFHSLVGSFETLAAMDTGHAVHDEVQATSR